MAGARCSTRLDPDQLATSVRTPLVALKGVSLRRGRQTILSNIDLSLDAGEILTVVGPNGGGKTTLLKVVLGLVKPDEGTVAVRPGLRIGYVPQRLHLDATLPLTVRRLMRLTHRHAEADLVASLNETGVAHLVDADVTTLSGGEFQRVLIARALLARPEMLVLDEPVQGVDFSGEVALYEKIAEIRQRHGCGVLLVSHDLHVVMAASDRVICLNTPCLLRWRAGRGSRGAGISPALRAARGGRRGALSPSPRPHARSAWRGGRYRRLHLRPRPRALTAQPIVGALRSIVRDDVHEPAEWVTHVEAPNAPWLGRRSVLDHKARFRHLPENLVKIVDLDREVWHLRA